MCADVLYTGVHTYAHLCVHIWQPEMDNVCFPVSLSTLVLRQSLSLNLEHRHTASPPASATLRNVLSSPDIIDTSHSWILPAENLTLKLAQQTLRLLSHPQPRKSFGVPNKKEPSKGLCCSALQIRVFSGRRDKEKLPEVGLFTGKKGCLSLEGRDTWVTETAPGNDPE